MTEILTESFCERCGTRYTFESAAPRQRRLGGLKVLGRGLQHFVMSDDSSLDESIAAARSDLERDATNNQLDAFHRTFSFCMSCRQYTCTNCWNETEARCLSCAPLEIAELAPVLETEIDPDRLLRFMSGQSESAHRHDPAVPLASAPSEPAGTEPAILALPHDWAGAGNGADIATGATEPVAATAEPVAAEPVAADPITAGAVAADPITAEAVAAGAVAVEPGGVAVEPTAGLDGLADGQSLDDAIAEFELALEAEAATPAARPSAETDSLGDTPTPTPVAAEPPVVAEPLPVPGQTALEPPVAAEVPPGPQPTSNAVDSVVQPIWRAPADPAASPPQWPTGPRWPTGVPARATPTHKAAPVDALAALMARSSTDAMWAASSQEIFQPAAAIKVVASVHSCGNCGISLSANARFCRRCGTPQG